MDAALLTVDDELLAGDITTIRIADVENRLTDLADLDVEVDVDPAAEASVPDGGRSILNPEGLAPGCVVENVYVLPGLPGEMKAMFAEIRIVISHYRIDRPTAGGRIGKQLLQSVAIRRVRRRDGFQAAVHGRTRGQHRPGTGSGGRGVRRPRGLLQNFKAKAHEFSWDEADTTCYKPHDIASP